MADMADEVTKSLVGKAADSLFDVVKKEFGYMWNSKKRVAELKSECVKLKNKRSRVDHRMTLATEKGDKLLDDVKKWSDEAKAHITMAEAFLQEEADANKTFFNLPMCVNLSTLYHYGKEATKKVSSLEQHRNEGAALIEDGVSIPTPVPGRLDIYPWENIVELDTHKSLLKKITRSVLDENIQITGIYGTGGVGKTTLATQVAATVKGLFALVVFVTVSQRVDAASIKTQVEIAAKRIKHQHEKVLIILDDVWSEVKLHEVGIPCGKTFPSCKILLTSRSSSVCTAMNAQTIICVKSLPFEEGWALFKHVVGERVETDAKLNQVARKVVDGCGGLPLILQAVGKALKDKDNFIEYEEALVNIAKDETSDTGRALRVEFARLKLSYDYLESGQVKSVFLLCSLFPEDFNIPLESLAYYCVGLKIFTDLKSLEAARKKVEGAVTILKSSCLLLDGNDESTTKMHDVVREVALLIASKDDNNFLVEAGKNLREWKPRIGSLESYTGISLMFNDICKLPAGYELDIPLLKIFLIQENRRLSEISDEFIQAMKEAKVIDLENNNIISLPRSLNQLTRLRMLNLGGNYNLRDVSILGELKQLEILILSRTGITEIPQEIGKLVNLRLFHAALCPYLSHIGPGVLPKLRWLEELSIQYNPVKKGKDDSLVEIGKLSNLKSLNLWVKHICLIPEVDYLKGLKRFSIQFGGEEDCSDYGILGDRALFLDTLDYADIISHSHVRKLVVVCDGIVLRNIGLNNLDQIMPTEVFGLKALHIIGCNNLLYLVDSSVLDKMPFFYPSENRRFLSEVEELELTDLDSLKAIWNCPDKYISLNNLVTLEILNCPELEKLFSVSVAEGLYNLKELTIQYCGSLKEVISDRVGETSASETVPVVQNIVFRSLTKICLKGVWNLESFYPGNVTIKYPSLVELQIYGCEKMKKWGNGTHDTPKLQFAKINFKKVKCSTIDEAMAKYKEAVELEKNLRSKKKLEKNQRLVSSEEGPSSV